MTVSIIGWYGTETMGDRAILDGILSVLSRIDPVCRIQIGSLYKFFTERTLYDEKIVFNQTAPFIQLSIFDIKTTSTRNNALIQSDIVIIGGGPLMHIDELILLQKSLEYAKKYHIPSVIMGCGLGPLERHEHISVVEKILCAATKISFRDNLSVEFAKLLYGSKFRIDCLGDPAVISIENYKKVYKRAEEAYIAVNFREFSYCEYGSIGLKDFEYELEFLKKVQLKYEKIILIPMHTFRIGGDDRYYLSKLANKIKGNQIQVLHNPLNLHEIYRIFSDAYGCVGMRYHSIVMQTILNGNNIVFDYTDAIVGKIQGFLNMINGKDFYIERTFSLKADKQKSIDVLAECMNQQQYFPYEFSNMKEKYVDYIKEVC